MPLITSANAREMAAKGNWKRWHCPDLKPVAQPEPAKEPDYSDIMLARTRKQLDKIAKLIDEELDSKKPDHRRLRDFSDAQTKVSELERILDGRPLPGSRKPEALSRRSAQQPVAWPADEQPSQPTPLVFEPPKSTTMGSVLNPKNYATSEDSASQPNPQI